MTLSAIITHPALVLPQHQPEGDVAAVAAELNRHRLSRILPPFPVPVAPDAIQQLHEGKREVEAEEKEEIS